MLALEDWIWTATDTVSYRWIDLETTSGALILSTNSQNIEVAFLRRLELTRSFV